MAQVFVQPSSTAEKSQTLQEVFGFNHSQAHIKNRAVSVWEVRNQAGPSSATTHQWAWSAEGIPHFKKQTTELPICDSKGIRKCQCLAVSLHLVLLKNKYITLPHVKETMDCGRQDIS